MGQGPINVKRVDNVAAELTDAAGWRYVITRAKNCTGCGLKVRTFEAAGHGGTLCSQCLGNLIYQANEAFRAQDRAAAQLPAG